MTFGNPRMLWLLAAGLPLLLWFLVWAWRKRQSLIKQFVQSRLLAQLTVGVSTRRQKLRLVLYAIIATLLLITLAQPRFGFAWEEVHQRGLDILVAIDASRSMLAPDVAPNRLTRAKLAALDLMRTARSDRLGLVAFAGTAFLQCPLTLDDTAFSESVNYLDVNTIPQGGTAIAEAIETSINAFKESDDNYKILILITDGEDHEQGVMEAAGKAAQAGIRIFTVAVGTPEGERLPSVDATGKTTYLEDVDGKPVVSKVNFEILQQIASTTGGDAIVLRGADPMKLLYDARLAPLPKSDLATRLFRQYHERFQWPLSLAILLLMAELFVTDRRRALRGNTGSPTPNPALRAAVSLLLAAICLPQGIASQSQAQRAYEKGRFEDAQREYQRLLSKQPNDPRLHYNAGTAAFQARNYSLATNELEQAILSPDPDLLARTYYNLGNAQYRLGENAPDPSQAMAHWQLALQNYDHSLKLQPKDPDAQFNRDFVARKLEELKQQQPQQNQPKDDQNQQDQNDQKDNQDRQNPSQSSKDQPKDQNPQPKPDPSKDSQANQPQPKPDRPQPDQEKKTDRDQTKADQPKPQESEQKPDAAKDAAQAKPQPDAKEGDRDPQAAGAPLSMGQMTPEQARQLLEAARSEERPMIFVPPAEPKHRRIIRREW